MKAVLQTKIPLWDIAVFAELAVWEPRPELQRLCAACADGIANSYINLKGDLRVLIAGAPALVARYLKPGMKVVDFIGCFLCAAATII